VIDAKVVKLALVSFMDEQNQQVTALAVIGDNNVHMLESRSLGISRQTTPQGVASTWLRDGIFAKLSGTEG
jgi:hypothetical protein